MESEKRKYQKAQWHRDHRDLSTARSKQWHTINRERSRSLKAAWVKRNKEKVKAAHQLSSWKRMGIKGATWELYRQLQEAQGGLCAICHNPPNPKRSLCLDHDHKTGIPRGLLCNRCNYLIVGLEWACQSQDRLGIALRYLGLTTPHPV